MEDCWLTRGLLRLGLQTRSRERKGLERKGFVILRSNLYFIRFLDQFLLHVFIKIIPNKNTESLSSHGLGNYSSFKKLEPVGHSFKRLWFLSRLSFVCSLPRNLPVKEFCYLRTGNWQPPFVWFNRRAAKKKMERDSSQRPRDCPFLPTNVLSWRGEDCMGRRVHLQVIDSWGATLEEIRFVTFFLSLFFGLV